jgi:hypothetical protein
MHLLVTKNFDIYIEMHGATTQKSFPVFCYIRTCYLQECLPFSNQSVTIKYILFTGFNLELNYKNTKINISIMINR